MATRTISNTGGNYNSTATWVEGIVPTSADDIAATATSGPLTINVSSAARNINLTNYNNTITFNATWTISGGAFTNTISSTTNFAGTGGEFAFTGAASTMTMNTTNRIPNLRITGNKTFTTDWYCVNYPTNATSILNTHTGAFKIDISGNCGVQSSAAPTATINGVGGDLIYLLTGSGFISFTLRGGPGRIEMDTTGTYSTPSQGLMLNSAGVNAANTPEFRLVNGNLDPSFRITIMVDTGGSNNNYNINIAGSKQIDSLILTGQFLNSAGRNKTINLDPVNGLNCRNIFLGHTITRNFTSDNATPIYIFRGGGLSASNVSLTPTLRATSAGGDVTYDYRACDIRLDSDFTHSFGALQCVGMLETGTTNTRPIISSITASQTANINLLSKTSSQCINYNFTDINAVGEEIVAINGVLTRTTNVTNVYPTGGTGGGVAGGSFTFVN